MEIWGKSKVKGKTVKLAEHINDVITVFEYLKIKINSGQLVNLIRLAIKYHDLGKILPYFQLKTLKNGSYKPFDVYADIPHSLFSALLINQEFLDSEISYILGENEKNDYSQFVLSAVAYHHWRESFYDIIEGYTDVFENLSELVTDKEKWPEIEKNLQLLASEIHGLQSGEIQLNTKVLEGLQNGIKYADYFTPPYQLYRMPKRIGIDNKKLKDWVLISGFTMISDHFASFVETEYSFDEKSEQLSKVEVAPLDETIVKENIVSRLKRIIGDDYQEDKIWQFKELPAIKNENTILLAPTGMGKTEFAFLWAAGKKFFYTLPLRAAVNQIFDRTREVFGVDASGILHSDADIYIFGDGGEEEAMRIYDFSRQLSLTANISTGDQFFPYALRPPGYEKIFTKFSYSNLIIDEIQAYDPKAAAIAVKFMEHIVQMGSKFLLMTATLPSFIQKEIENRIGAENFKEVNLFEKFKEVGTFEKHSINLLIDEYSDGKLSFKDEIINKIINAAKKNGGQRVLVVMNTVKQAQRVFNDIVKSVSKNYEKDEIEIKLFHSRYSHKHRESIEKYLEKFIGNNDDSRGDKRPKILVATQVVEASLDLDADYLFTELAPWDALIQRMGRVLRQLRYNSEDFNQLINSRYNSEKIPDNIYVIIYDGKKNGKEIFESGGGWVYKNELLLSTLKLIELKDNKVEIEELKKYSNGKKKVKLSGLVKKYKNNGFLLSENKKNQLVKMLYESLSDESNYLKEFYDMLQILDAGYMSDRKTEAQRIFREINDVGIIPENLKDEFVSKIIEFDFDNKRSFTRFKKDIISRFVVNIQRYKVEEYLTDFNLIAKQIELNDKAMETESVYENINRLKKWLWGIYFADVEYNNTNGLTGVNEKNNTFEVY